MYHSMDSEPKKSPLWLKLVRFYIYTAQMLFWLVFVAFLAYELKTSRLQADYLSRFARELTFWMGTGESPAIRFPATGPCDERRGYVDLPGSIQKLKAGNYSVAAQARFSPQLIELTDTGFFTPHHEKDQAGLQILDRNNQNLFDVSWPARVYPSFEAIPEVVVKSLLFIENRELLDLRYPNRNPAVDWGRLGKAALQRLSSLGNGNGRGPGGSTLATQIEKFRHSPEGRTIAVKEKFLQMGSATLRAYLDGPITLDAQCGIILEYINAIPLGAFPGYGEIIGLGDGLWAWYGAEFDAINYCLARRPHKPDDPGRSAWGHAFKQALSLFLAQRRPALYLIENLQALESLTDQYVRLLAQEGILSPVEKDAALEARLRLRRTMPVQYEGSFLERKAANAIRLRLLSMLDVSQLYKLDRLDLTVASSLDARVQEDITWQLHQLRTPAAARNAGLYGYHLLSTEDPGKIIYSFTLYERGPATNFLRIQTDNYDQPLNINEGIKLELGSTAKLRTLVTYLEIIAELYRNYSDRPRDELANVGLGEVDSLTRWATGLLAASENVTLGALLEAALERQYSANPYENFFTGGGLHTFANFNHNDDGRVMSVRDAFRNSVNLVFIRMMRDIVHYYIYQQHESLKGPITNIHAPGRREYLARFADQEGQKYLARFYAKYRGKKIEDAVRLLISGIKPSPVRLAVIFRSVMPDADLLKFTRMMRDYLPQSELSGKTLQTLYRRYAPDAYSLVDQGFLAHVHPLELWMVSYLQRFPKATLADVVRDSAVRRQEVYTWLFKTQNKETQDTRIQIMMENEAFQEIHRAWQRLGYPFDALVPSYATAIGSAADRPAALAELVGIILSNGVYNPTLRIQKLHFAKDTPYETIMTPAQQRAEQALAPEVAAALRRELAGVVEHGTATKVNKVFCGPDGSALEVGGKTGTGDNRYDVYNAEGDLVRSTVINRTATFVFFIGDRFFGTITAYVAGSGAADYNFTSTLPVQVLKSLAPKLLPLINGAEGQTVSSNAVNSPVANGR